MAASDISRPASAKTPVTGDDPETDAAVSVISAQRMAAQRREAHVSESLLQVAQTMSGLCDSAQLAQTLVPLIKQVCDVRHAAIGFWKTLDAEVSLHQMITDDPDVAASLSNVAAMTDCGLLGRILEAKEPFLVESHNRKPRQRQMIAWLGTQDMLVAPVPRSSSLSGAVLLCGEPARRFSVYDLSLAKGIAHQIAIGLEQAHLLARLERERKQLSAVLLGLPDGVVLVDGAGQILYCNPRLGTLLRGHAETLVDCSYHVLFEQIAAHAGSAEKTRCDLERALDRLPDFPVVEVTLAQPDPVHLQFHFFPVRHEAGQRNAWGCAVRDVTHARERLNRVSSLLANISHELRSPLAAIKGFVAMLSSDHPYWDGARQPAFLQSINESADQLGRLIENVLELSRLDAGVTDVRRRTLALEMLIQRTVQAARFVGRLHEFEIDIPDPLPEVEVDPLRIEQVLRNLLENAVKFSPAGSKVIVRATPQGDEIVIAVQDHGVGIAGEFLDRIFDPFFQVNHLVAGLSAGVGLGLHLCREIVSAHGGRIWASSELNKGSTIYFTIPSAGAPIEPTPAPPAISTIRADAPPATEPLAWNIPTVLIVEDDPTMLRLLKTTLETGGYRVVTACSGWAALDFMSRQPSDLVLLDLVLPDLDGFQVCERLREFSAVPVIMVTARTDTRDEVRGLNLGADDYIRKPFSQKEILARVQAVLRRTRAQETVETAADLYCGDLALNFARRQVLLRGRHVALSSIEYRLLRQLASNAGRVLTHRQLLSTVWGPEYVNDTHYLWVGISRLRKKLEDAPAHPRYIITEPRVGYRFGED